MAVTWQNQIRKWGAAVLTGVLIFSCLGSDLSMAVSADTAASAAFEAKAGSQTVQETVISSANQSASYQHYLSKYANAAKPDTTITIPLASFTAPKNTASLSSDIPYKNGKALLTADMGYVEWTFTVQAAGLYNLGMTYYPVAGKGASIVRRLLLDGQMPYEECRNLTFDRCFANASKTTTDASGNQIRPQQKEAPRWMTVDMQDTIGYYMQPLQFYLSAGAHKLRFEAVREPLLIGSLKLYQAKQPQSYTASSEAKNSTGGYIRIQGEDASLKSDNLTYPISDSSSPATDPSNPGKILLNTIGGTKWENCGQWIQWDFNVKTAGWYVFGVKFRQNTVAGQASYRKVLLDGQVPCKEWNDVSFSYNSQWQMKALGNGNEAYSFYLDKGSHTLTMEAVLGDLAPLVQQVNESMTQLNMVYRNLLMVIGHSPDTTRDYQFDKTAPEEVAAFTRESKRLQAVYDQFVKLNSIGGYQAQILKGMVDLTKELGRYPDRIAKRFDDFSSNLSSLGTWVKTAESQPLEIDYIEVCTPEHAFSSPSAGMLPYLSFVWKQFLASFVTDYNAIGKAAGSDKSVTVWLSSGRDQASALSQMASNNFTAKTGIGVNIQLVANGALLSATLAHKGPDIALSLGQSDPMNYAIRGAVQDLSRFPDSSTVFKRFQDSAVAPLRFGGKVYGLPETQAFPMLFYRTDILSQLHLSVPQTWDDVIAMLPVLQKKNLNFGLPLPYSAAGVGVGLPAYGMFLYQNGGDFYTAGGKTSALDSGKAAEAFAQWASFYNDYSLPAQYDFNNRFRSGEVPIGIADYGTYNALSVFAPELDGVWKLAPVPGTRKADGTIDRSVASTVTASVMMADAKDPANAWEFLKWWTSAQAQEDYGRELESIMGTAGRYQTANIEALYHIPWSTSDFQMLTEQWMWTKCIPEVPGSYMTARYVDFAFKQAVVTGNEDTNRVLLDAVRQINQEVKAKRKEFGLS